MALDARSREQQAIDRLLAAWKRVGDDKTGLYVSKEAADRFRGAASEEGSL